MGWEEALLSAFSPSIPWETFRLHSGSSSFCLQAENQGQMFQRATHCRRQDCPVTMALSRDFTCCPCNREVLRFNWGFLTHCCLFTPFSTTPDSLWFSHTSVGKSGLSRSQTVFDGGSLSLPVGQVGLTASFMPAAWQSHFSHDPSPQMIW